MAKLALKILDDPPDERLPELLRAALIEAPPVQLRQIEVSISVGKSTQIACREAGISEQGFYRWRKEYSGLDLDQARRMKDLEKENVRRKRLVADLSLEKQILKSLLPARNQTVRTVQHLCVGHIVARRL